MTKKVYNTEFKQTIISLYERGFPGFLISKIMETLIANIQKGKTALNKSISNYARMGIDIEILEIENNSVLVKATQKILVYMVSLFYRSLCQKYIPFLWLLLFRLNTLPQYACF